MKKLLTVLAALALAACTSTRSLPADEQGSLAGLSPGAMITLDMADGERRKVRFESVENGQIAYRDRSGAVHRVAPSQIVAINYREYDADKTGTVVAGTATVAGAVLLGFVQVLGAFAQGM